MTLTIRLLSLALDASLMQTNAIANNVANISTPGYQTIEVDFEKQLHALGEIKSCEDLKDITPKYQISNNHSSLDQQMALNVSNTTHYRALIKGINQAIAITKLAIQGNNAA